MSDLISRQAAIDAFIGEPPDLHYPSWYAEVLKNMPSAELDVPDTNVGDINKFIDGLEEIFADLRETHVDDSVCGLCEYDGAYIGQSGDWCNECPGFEKDDCFKLSLKIRKKWTDEIIKALSSAEPERKTGKWIGGSDERFVKCSECGMESTKNALMEIALFGEKEPHFCPNCGSYNGGMEHGIIKHHYQNPIRRKKNDSD